MKANPHIDELLCSFIDGELPLRQQTEVQRLLARDPDVARRLRQLQDCATLMSALPREEAPGEMLEQITFSLERRTLLAEHPVSPSASVGARHLMLRRFMAAAAMIALLAVLGAVVYQIVAPVPQTGTPPILVDSADQPRIEADRTVTTPTVVADSGFSGRLEIQTGLFVQADAFIKKVVADTGLLSSVESDTTGSRRIYRLVSTREGINRLVMSLREIWPNFENATLYVESPKAYASAVAVETVTPEQTANIVAQSSAQASIRTAGDYAVLNGIAKDMSGREVLSLLNDGMDSASALSVIPRTWPTGIQPAGKTPARPEGKTEARLTIILVGTR